VSERLTFESESGSDIESSVRKRRERKRCRERDCWRRIFRLSLALLGCWAVARAIGAVRGSDGSPAAVPTAQPASRPAVQKRRGFCSFVFSAFCRKPGPRSRSYCTEPCKKPAPRGVRRNPKQQPTVGFFLKGAAGLVIFCPWLS